MAFMGRTPTFTTYTGAPEPSKSDEEYVPSVKIDSYVPVSNVNVPAVSGMEMVSPERRGGYVKKGPLGSNSISSPPAAFEGSRWIRSQ